MLTLQTTSSLNFLRDQWHGANWALSSKRRPKIVSLLEAKPVSCLYSIDSRRCLEVWWLPWDSLERRSASVHLLDQICWSSDTAAAIWADWAGADSVVPASVAVQSRSDFNSSSRDDFSTHRAPDSETCAFSEESFNFWRGLWFKSLSSVLRFCGKQLGASGCNGSWDWEVGCGTAKSCSKVCAALRSWERLLSTASWDIAAAALASSLVKIPALRSFNRLMRFSLVLSRRRSKRSRTNSPVKSASGSPPSFNSSFESSGVCSGAGRESNSRSSGCWEGTTWPAAFKK